MKTPFKMKGWGGYQSSPLTKKIWPPGESVDADKQVELSKHEIKKGTEITGGDNAQVIADLEDRIEFLRSDLKGGGEGKINYIEIGKQIAKLETRLKKEKAK